MTSYLQIQILNRLKAKDLTVNGLEKKAGLKRNAARNILQGFSKKPSASTLKAIAEVLECSLDDLVGPGDNTVSNVIKISYPWNENLYINVIKAISKILNGRKIELNFDQIIALASESYKYSLSKKSNKTEHDFINWLVDKSI